MGSTRRQLLAATAGAVSSIALGARSEQPNLLLVLSDDHSVPFLGPYGAKYLKTPALDRFAAESIRFEHAFTTAPQCVPSRTGIMTGRSPVAVRMGRFSLPLAPEVRTLPEVLRDLGYYTGVCGRYFHLDGVINPNEITQEIYEKHHLRTWDRRVDYKDVSPQAGTPAKFQEFLGKVPKEKPWFFWINYSDPHHPWETSAGRVKPADVDVPAYLPDLPGVREDLAAYSAEVERADRSFADALAVLEKSGAADKTIVLFMGDNGLAFPHGKGSLYDPGLNVPLLIRWPGKARPGVNRDLISGEDLAPTLIGAAGGNPPAEMTGNSFLGLLDGRAGYKKRNFVFAARVHHGNGAFKETTKADEFDLSRCVRSERWKLIYNCTPQMTYQPVDSSQNPGWQQMVAAHRDGRLSAAFEKAYFGKRAVLELYDLETDRPEFENVAGDPRHSAVVQEHLEALQEKMITDRDYLPAPLGEALPKKSS
jgi:N-sulfoglucosamine sulfohydrolase